MAERTIEIATLEHRDDEETIFLTFAHPDEELPVGHVIPYATFVFRAAEYRMDVTHGRFHRDALVRILHEAHTPVGVHPARHLARGGQIHDLKAANEHTEWVIPRWMHVEMWERIRIEPVHVTSLRLQLAGQHPLPPLPRAETMIVPSTKPAEMPIRRVKPPRVGR